MLDRRRRAGAAGGAAGAGRDARSEKPGDGDRGRCSNDRERRRDRWMPDAATSAAAPHDDRLPASRSSRRARRRRAIADDRGRAIVAEHYARGGPVDRPAAGRLRSANADVADAPTAVVARPGRGLAGRSKPPTLDDRHGEGARRPSMPALPANGQPRSSTWPSAGAARRSRSTRPSIARTLPRSARATRRRATPTGSPRPRQLVEFRRNDADASVDDARRLITPRPSPELASGPGRRGRPQRRGRASAPSSVDALPALTPAVRARRCASCSARPDWTTCAARRASRRATLPARRAVARPEAGAGRPSRPRRSPSGRKTLLERGGGLPNADRQKVIDELLPLIDEDRRRRARARSSSRRTAPSATSTAARGRRSAPT